MRIILYARVSSKEKQGENFSIGSQLAAMRAACTIQGWQIVAELSEQDSAFLDGLERSQLNKARAMAHNRQVDALMFYSPDRFTRDMADGVILRRDLKRAGVKLMCYYPQPHEITSDNELVNILTDWRSQQFVEKLREAYMAATLPRQKPACLPRGSHPMATAWWGRSSCSREVGNVRYYHARRVNHLAGAQSARLWRTRVAALALSPA